MGLKVTVKPESEPLELDEVKLHLRVDHDDEDSLIESMIAAAREYCENFCRRSFITQTLTFTLDEFPSVGVKASCYDGYKRKYTDYIELPNGPVQSIESLEYWDTTEDEYIEIEAADYQLSNSSAVVDRLAPAPNTSWPTPQSGRLDAVKVQYIAGYGDDGEDVPRAIRNAMLLLIATWYANREAFLLATSGQAFPTPVGVDALLWGERSYSP